MRVRTGCGCMSLQTGSIVIASLSIVSSILSAIFIGVFTTNLMGEYSSSKITSHDEANLLVMKIIFVGVIIYLLMCGGFAALLIYGSVQKKAGYMFPWIAITCSGFLGHIAFNIGTIIVTAVYLSVGGFFGITIVNVLSAVIQIYLWTIVYSHYKDILAVNYAGHQNPSDGKVFIQPMNPYHNV